MTVQMTAPDHVPAELVVDIDIFRLIEGPGDVHQCWKNLQVAHPDAELIYTPQNEGHWIAMRGQTVQEIFSDHTRFSSRCVLVTKSRNDEVALPPINLDPPEHAPHRAMINPGLAPRAILQMEPTIRAVANESIAAFKASGRCEFVNDYAEVLPIRVFMNLMNLPVEDVPMLKAWSRQFNSPTGAPGEMTASAVMQAYLDYLTPHVIERRASPGDDMLSRIATGRPQGELLTVKQAADTVTMVMMAGLDTVVNSLGFVMMYMANHPEQRRKLIADPTLIPGAVDELLRRFAVVVITREVKNDIVYKGVPMKGGDMIALPPMLHGLDDREFENPMDVDFSRTIERVATFGAGQHRCPGSFLARTELRITLETWLSHIPEFEIEPEARISMRSGQVQAIDVLPLRWSIA